MKYLGSKRRIQAELIDTIFKHVPDHSQRDYVEPFCGGLNMIQHIPPNSVKSRIANDAHYYLIQLYKALTDTAHKDYPFFDTLKRYTNNLVTEDIYQNIRRQIQSIMLSTDISYPPSVIGFVGFNCSFGASFMAGYARYNETNEQLKNKTYISSADRYTTQGINNLRKHLPLITSTTHPHHNITFHNLHYIDLTPYIPNNSIIYCDPPYEGTTDYTRSTRTTPYPMQHVYFPLFWQWVRNMTTLKGCKVFVSSYATNVSKSNTQTNIPKDFVSIWQKDIKCDFDKNNKERHSIKTEHLFIYQPTSNT